MILQRRAYPKNRVTKGVLSCSYNTDGDRYACEERVQRQVRDEIAKGKKPSHLIIRSTDNPAAIKFNLPIRGIPLFLYPLLDMHNAGLEKIVIVGNEDTRLIHSGFVHYFKAKNHVFVHEGELDELSRANTIKKAISGLGELDNENIIDVSGDTPLVRTRAMVNDRDNFQYDLILSINVKEVAGTYFPRNYHWAFVHEGKVYTAKEPNIWMWDLKRLQQGRFGFNLFDMIYGSRKAYGTEKTMGDVIKEILIYEGGKFSPKRLVNNLTILGLEGVCEGIRVVYRMIKHLPEDENALARVQAKTAENLVRYNLGHIRTRLKPCLDPAGLLDIDSLEDVVFTEALLQEHPDCYAHMRELEGFARFMNYKWDSEIADNWREIANEDFRRYNIQAGYSRDGMQQTLFSPESLESQASILLKYAQSIKG